MRIYLATSWRNGHTDAAIGFLRQLGHDVYDFRAEGFAWTDAAVNASARATAEDARRYLAHPIARAGYTKDMTALGDCDAVVLVLPAGRSAHLEAGWAAGRGRPVVVYQPEAEPPELMHGMCRAIVGDLAGLAEALADL